MSEVCRYRDDICNIAREVGKRILDVYERGFDVEQKGDGSPLTEADRAANEVIGTALARLTPDIPVLSGRSGDGGSEPAPAGSGSGSWTRSTARKNSLAATANSP